MTNPAAPTFSPLIEYGWRHVVEQTIEDARLNLLRKEESLQRSLVIYSDPDDYRRERWMAELAQVQHSLGAIDSLLNAAYQAAMDASDCGNCSPHRQHPHAAHTTPCPCGCQRTMRIKEVRA